MPLASVIIPTYNGGKITVQTIERVLSQSAKDIEVIIVDDGSTDEPHHKAMSELKDRRIQYFLTKNKGTPAARNFGLSRARGTYVAFLDHDDLWPLNYLEEMIEQLEKNPEFGVAYSPISLSFPDGTFIRSYKAPLGKSGDLTVDLFKRGFIWTSAAVMRKSVLNNFRYDESLVESYEDGDFFLRLSVKIKFLFVNTVQAIRKEHHQNLSSKVGVMPTRIQVLERFYFKLGGSNIVPATIARKKLSHECRKVAKSFRQKNERAATLTLLRKAMKYYPLDFRLYPLLTNSLLLSRKKDPNPDWQFPVSLSDEISSISFTTSKSVNTLYIKNKMSRQMTIRMIRNRFTAIEPYIAGKIVLDIGCVDARPDGKKEYRSTGLHRFLYEHASQLVGVDIDRNGIKQMNEYGYNVIEANAEYMDLGKRFDCIVAGEVIEHLSNQGLFLENMKRHLAENGVLIITAPNAFSILSFWRILRHNRIKVHAEHTCWYDPMTIQQLVGRYSFEIEKLFVTNKSKWYLKKNFYKLKYQIPKLISSIRPYFSGVIIVIARQKNHSTPAEPDA